MKHTDDCNSKFKKQQAGKFRETCFFVKHIPNIVGREEQQGLQSKDDRHPLEFNKIRLTKNFEENDEGLHFRMKHIKQNNNFIRWQKKNKKEETPKRTNEDNVFSPDNSSVGPLEGGDHLESPVQMVYSTSSG